MRQFITLILTIFSVSILTAQTETKSFYVGDIISDTNTFSNKPYRKTLPPLLKSKNKIEIRFITSPSFYSTNYVVLIYSEEWSAKYYYHKPGVDSLLSREITKNINIDTLFSKLVSNNIFSLPDQDSLRTEKFEYFPTNIEVVGSGMGVADGICYYIEFKIGNYFRRYNYCNPDIYANFYPQVHQLRNFTNIVEIFKELPKE